MNPRYNPSLAVSLLRSYVRDPGRLERLSPTALQRYKNKVFNKILADAFTVPLYRDKYKAAGLSKNSITGINDITKLPFVDRQDFRSHFPDGVLPAGYDKQYGSVICTGGTTGKYCCNSGSQPVCLYTDLPTMLRPLGITLREHRALHINSTHTKIAHLGNFNPYKSDEYVQTHVQPYLEHFISFNNYLAMPASDPMSEIIKKLEAFRPDVIISYPAIFQELAYQKTKGNATHITPRFLQVGGEMLDPYTRWYVETTFHCPMYNVYGSCESGANIAFECTERNWHIHSDYFHIEAIDKNNQPVSPGERGRIVVTRLWPGATPIIRYTGMEDWITLSTDRACGCGLHSPIFEKPVEGRVLTNIILPDGTSIPPSRFLHISDVLIRHKTFKVHRYQIIQHAPDDIEILLVIDPELRTQGPSISDLINDIIKEYRTHIGPTVRLNVHEVDTIPDDPTSGKPAPLVISKLTQPSCPVTS